MSARTPRPRAPRRARPRRPTSRVRKRFGQHFLAPAWARRVVGVIGPEPGDVFLEIGPGRGALTLPLAESGAPILAVEIDRGLVADLAPRLPPNVTLLSGDFLTTDVIAMLSGLEPQRPPQEADQSAGARRFRVVGNLPYSLASPILFRLIDWHRRERVFADATVMLQREVADRLVARPGTKDYGVLTVMLGVHARVARKLDLPPGAFTPPPKVRSSVVRLTFGPPGRSPARRGDVRSDGQGGFQPASQDARQRAPGLRRDGSGRARAGRHRRPGAGPRRCN